MRLIVLFPCLRIFVVKTFAIPMLVVLQTALQHLFFKVKKITFQSLDPFAASSQDLCKGKLFTFIRYPPAV
jgi:hypothetical protein